MYYPIYINRPVCFYKLHFINKMCIMNYRRNNMNDKKQLECQLDCKASASLKQSIVQDLKKEDGSIEELLNGQREKTKDTEDTGN